MMLLRWQEYTPKHLLYWHGLGVQQFELIGVPHDSCRLMYDQLSHSARLLIVNVAENSVNADITIVLDYDQAMSLELAKRIFFGVYFSNVKILR